MRILDDLNHTKANIDDVISLLQEAKAQGDTIVKVTYAPCGYEQAMLIVTSTEEVTEVSHT